MKYFTIILVIILCGLLVILGTIFSVKKARDYLYREVGYQFIVKQTVGKEDREENIALLLFDYIRDNLHVVGGEVVDKTTWNDLVRGIAWCDQQSWDLATLLSKKNIHARIAMLVDKDGISPHTVTEVFLDGEWKAFDPLYGLIFRKPRDGSLATLEEISNDFSLISEHPKVKALPRMKYEEFLSTFRRMFPLPKPPRRWGSLLLKKNNNFANRFTNRLITIFVRLSPKLFINKYQDIYLFLNSRYFNNPEEELYYKARNYHLYGRADAAERNYKTIIKLYPHSKRTEDSQFFLGVLDEQLRRDRKGAIEEFNRLFEKYQNTRWANVAHYFLGRVYEEAGDLEKAKVNYSLSNSDLNTDAAFCLMRLSNG